MKSELIITIMVPIQVKKFLNGYFGSDVVLAHHNAISEGIKLNLFIGEDPEELEGKLAPVKLSVSNRIYDLANQPLFADQVSNNIARYLHSLFLHALSNYVIALTDDGQNIDDSCRKFLDKYNIDLDELDYRSAAKVITRYRRFKAKGKASR